MQYHLDGFRPGDPEIALAQVRDRFEDLDAAAEAIRLGRLLVALLSEPEAMGLLGLMLIQESRRAEGASLATVLEGQLSAIEALTLQAEADPSREPASIRQRLEEQVRLLMDAAPGLDEARLHQEAAFLATKADNREEIDVERPTVCEGLLSIISTSILFKSSSFAAK
jgi:hypothetical protein